MFYKIIHITIFLLCFIFSACYTYKPIHIIKKIKLEPVRLNLIIRKKSYTYNYHRIYIRKYFIILQNSTPLAIINKKAVTYALQGNFREAEILLLDIIKECKNEPAFYNNLAIIYEIFGKKKTAFTYYKIAFTLADSDNKIKNNYLLFEDTKYIRRSL